MERQRNPGIDGNRARAIEAERNVGKVVNFDRAQFEARYRSKPTTGRFRDRHWPAFARAKVRKQRKLSLPGHRHERIDRSIKRAAMLAEARGWLPYADLSHRHYMLVCDAVARYWRRGHRVV